MYKLLKYVIQTFTSMIQSVNMPFVWHVSLCVNVTPGWIDTIPCEPQQNPTEVLVVTRWHSLIYRQ